MKELSVEEDLVAEMAVHNPFDFFLEESATYFPFAYDKALARDLAPFLEAGPPGPNLTSYLSAITGDLLGHSEAVMHAPGATWLHHTDVHHGGGHLSLTPDKMQESETGSTTLAPAVKKEPLRTI